MSAFISTECEACKYAKAKAAQYQSLCTSVQEDLGELAQNANKPESDMHMLEQAFYTNANNAVNAVMAIANGELWSLSIEQCLLLEKLQTVYWLQVEDSRAAGAYWNEAGRKGRDAVLDYMATVGNLPLGGRAA